MIDGTFAHQDSQGGGGLIADGATQCMTAGGGILHIETPPEALLVSGGLFHGIQLWVNLPAKDKLIAPAYQGLEAGRFGRVPPSALMPHVPDPDPVRAEHTGI
jgi:redox-sensitive bicupin YhaK (pirin superfamily)